MNFRIAITLAVIIAPGTFAQDRPSEEVVDSTQLAIERALVKSRQVIDAYGVSDSAMSEIQTVLAELAAIPGIRSYSVMKPLHGSSSMGRAQLASESDSGITLYVSWLDNGAATPVHDHLTWGVVYVLEGRDKYTHWQRRVDSASGERRVETVEERVLTAGQSIHWLSPPKDIHSQQAVDGEVWELVITGRDLASDHVRKNQQRFDAETGREIRKALH